MKTLLWIFLALDCLIILFNLYETFVKQFKAEPIINIVLIICIVLGWWLQNSHFQWSIFIAGLPVSFVLLAGLFQLIYKTFFGNH